MPDADRWPQAPSQHRPVAEAFGIGRLFDQVRDAVVLSDRNGEIVLWNRAAVGMFGYASEEAQGRAVEMIVPERLKDAHDAGMARYRETGHGHYIDAGTILELPALRKDGGEIIVEMTLSRLEHEGTLYSMAVIRDVTERVRMRVAAEEDRRRLQEANDSLEAFSYVVGHDLKEPVRAVDAYLEAIEEDLKDPDAMESLRKARDANRRMRALLEGMLDWARATAGGLDREPVSIPDSIRSDGCAGRYGRLLEERGGELAFVGEFPKVLGTEGLLCQAFGNLIVNAIVHNPGPAPRIDVISEGVGDDGMLSVAVRDNGPGFPEAVRKRIGALRSTRPSTVRGGFGLTIAMRAVAALGGSLTVGDAPGGGAEVRLRLPLAEPRR